MSLSYIYITYVYVFLTIKGTARTSDPGSPAWTVCKADTLMADATADEPSTLGSRASRAMTEVFPGLSHRQAQPLAAVVVSVAAAVTRLGQVPHPQVRSQNFVCSRPKQCRPMMVTSSRIHWEDRRRSPPSFCLSGQLREARGTGTRRVVECVVSCWGLWAEASLARDFEIYVDSFGGDFGRLCPGQEGNRDAKKLKTCRDKCTN